jgi:hypothetical protein
MCSVVIVFGAGLIFGGINDDGTVDGIIVVAVG